MGEFVHIKLQVTGQLLAADLAACFPFAFATWFWAAAAGAAAAAHARAHDSLPAAAVLLLPMMVIAMIMPLLLPKVAALVMALVIDYCATHGFIHRETGRD
jgi:uncharacterized iron-regulated membrane protein